MMKQKVYVIVGPTASGKTAAAIELAKLINGEIISADSMQIYKKMNIGTAKPTLKEMQGIVHHMIDIVEPDDDFSVAMFQKMAKECIKEIFLRGKTPIVVGGTGLYINSITYLLDFTQTIHDEVLREKLNKLDNTQLHQLLKNADEQSAQRIHPNDKKRVIRRLEILQSGKTDSYDFDVPNTEHQFIISGLSTDRKLLYERINQRVDDMIQNGLIDEAKCVYNQYGGKITSMQAIGYKEIVGFFEDKISQEECIELIRRNTRRFAKRQLTWFCRDERINWINTTEFSNMKELAQSMIK
ncbi:MAG: tRNA (adenosine(37)-N6)-dimethylallyltransferase MiaA [Christensenellaceae bacterium]